MRWLWAPLGTLGGLGYARPAPGSVGSLLVTGLVWVVRPGPGSLALAALGVFFVGVAAASRLEAAWGAKDPGRVVIDEAAGMLVALLWVPPNLVWMGAAWVLFRGFDIGKPFPCRHLERVPGGWGVMVDDMMAGLYACGGVHALRWLVG